MTMMTDQITKILYRLGLMRYFSKLSAFGLACAITILGLGVCPLSAQQRADQNFQPEVTAPAFGAGEGPLILINEAHNNFHTSSERYAPFAKLLTADGYRVQGLNGSLSSEALAQAGVLVIANPTSAKNRGRTILSTYSAFTEDEIATVEGWIR